MHWQRKERWLGHEGWERHRREEGEQHKCSAQGGSQAQEQEDDQGVGQEVPAQPQTAHSCIADMQETMY